MLEVVKIFGICHGSRKRKTISAERIEVLSEKQRWITVEGQKKKPRISLNQSGFQTNVIFVDFLILRPIPQIEIEQYFLIKDISPPLSIRFRINL